MFPTSQLFTQLNPTICLITKKYTHLIEVQGLIVLICPQSFLRVVHNPQVEKLLRSGRFWTVPAIRHWRTEYMNPIEASLCLQSFFFFFLNFQEVRKSGSQEPSQSQEVRSWSTQQHQGFDGVPNFSIFSFLKNWLCRDSKRCPDWRLS